jgi:Fe-S oxidoreductase
MEVYDPPRKILKAIPEAELIELSENREMGICCGGGGDVEILDRQLVGLINANLVGEIEKTGASIAIEACPQCRRTTQEGIRTKGASVKSLDIVELVDQYGIFEGDN